MKKGCSLTKREGRRRGCLSIKTEERRSGFFSTKREGGRKVASQHRLPGCADPLYFSLLTTKPGDPRQNIE